MSIVEVSEPVFATSKKFCTAISVPTSFLIGKRMELDVSCWGVSIMAKLKLLPLSLYP